MKKTINRQLIILICLVTAGLVVGIGANFILNQQFDREIVDEKRGELEKHLESIMAGIDSIPDSEISREKVEAILYPIVENDRDIIAGYANSENKLEIAVDWNKETESPQSRELGEIFKDDLPKDGYNARNLGILRDKDKIRAMKPIIEEDRIIGVVWIEDSIISDANVFAIVRILTAITVLFSLLAGIFGVVYITRKLMRDVARINDGVEKMKGDLSHRIEVSSDELGQIAGEINRMAEKLEEQKALEERLHQADKLAALGQFVSGIAHELRNPLGIMKGSLQLMEKRGTLSEEDSEFIEIIKEQIERQNSVIEDLLRFAKPAKTNFELLDVEDVIDSMIKFAGTYLRDSNIEFTRRKSAVPMTVHGDFEKLKQIFLNLILNAAQAMPDGGKLLLETEVLGDGGLAIRFTDSGRGISEDEISDIFNPYFTTKEKGTGLGLSISYQLVKLHGGDIKAENSPDGGAVFTVLIPLAKHRRP